MDIKEIIDVLAEKYNPYSIFLYGSKATLSDNKKSDYEIGIIFEDSKYISRKIISDLINDKQYSIYPFKLSEVLNYDIDTPFQKNIYMSVLINGGAKTLYGEKVLEEMKAPHISTSDLLADINFNLGLALASVKVFKSNNIALANDMFYKSCLYVTRDLIYFSTQKLVITYNEIYEESLNLDIPDEYRNILKIAHSIRNEELVDVNSTIYFKNISYINKFILKEVKND